MHYKGNMQYTHYHIIDLYLNDVKVARCDVKSDKVLLSVGVAIVGKAIIIGAMAFDCRMTSTEAKKEFDDAISSIYPGRYDSGGFMYLDTKDFIEDNLKYKKWKDDQL